MRHTLPASSTAVCASASVIPTMSCASAWVASEIVGSTWGCGVAVYTSTFICPSNR